MWCEALLYWVDKVNVIVERKNKMMIMSENKA